MSVAEPAPAAPSSDEAPDAAPSGAVARIQSVEIENLRGIKSGKLEGLAPLTVLTGPNGSGKSTVLDALDIGGSPNPAEAVRDCVLRRPKTPGGPRWLIWRGGRGRAVVSVAAERCEMRTVEVGSQTTTDAGPDSLILGRFYNSMKQSVEQGQWYRAEFYSGGGVSLSDERFPIPGVQEVELIEGLHVGSGGGRGLADTFSSLVRDGRRKEANTFGRRLFPMIEHLEVLTDGGEAMLGLVFEDHAVPAQLGGDGAFASLKIALELLAVGEGVALLEEPEAHLHPAAMALVAKAIVNAVRSGTQVVLTTHSIEFIDRLVDEVGDDAAELLALFKVNLRDGQLVSARFPGEDVVFARDEIEKDLR